LKIGSPLDLLSKSLSKSGLTWGNIGMAKPVARLGFPNDPHARESFAPTFRLKSGKPVANTDLFALSKSA
jgi:hypothetical protein